MNVHCTKLRFIFVQGIKQGLQPPGFVVIFRQFPADQARVLFTEGILDFLGSSEIGVLVCGQYKDGQDSNCNSECDCNRLDTVN